MGKNDHKSIVGQETGPTAGKPVKSTGTPGTGDAGGRGRGRGTAAAGKSVQKSVELPNVDSPKIVAIELPKTDEKPAEPKKGRGRPPGSSKTKKAATVKKDVQADYTHIKILLITVSGVIAARPGMSMFALTEEESEQIARPLSNIMAKNESVAAVTSEYADHIALIFAVGTIFIGKYMAYRLLNPKPKKKENKLNVPTKQERPSNSSNKSNDSEPTNSNAPKTNDNTFNGNLNQLLNPIGGI